MFFNEDDASKLAELMRNIIDKKPKYDAIKEIIPQQPYAANWMELIKMITI